MTFPTGPEITRNIEGDDRGSSPYARWRWLAVRLLRRERRNHTLRPTELVHEAWLRLSKGGGRQRLQAEREGLALCAMRNALVDHARARQAERRESSRTVPLVEEPARNSAAEDDEGIESFRLAFERLEAMDAALADLMRLRFERGLTVEAAGKELGVSPRTVKRETRVARAWLQRELGR